MKSTAALTTAEILDELEARVAAVRARMESLAAEAASGAGRNGAAPAAAVGEKPAEPAPASRPDVNWTFPGTSAGAPPPSVLRIRMDLAGVGAASLAAAFGAPEAVVREWLSGVNAIPPWVLPALRMLELLPPAVRGKVLNTPAARAGRRSVNRHPFSRIEEL